MYEKNIVGTYNIADQYPVFKSGNSKDEPLIKPVAYSPTAIQEVSGIRGSVGNVQPLDQWRSFSEALRDRRLALERQEEAEPYPQEGGQGGSQERAPQKRQYEELKDNSSFQNDYERDQVSLSSMDNHTSPLYHTIKHYLSVVQEPSEYVATSTYTTPNIEFKSPSDGSLRVGDVMTTNVTCVLETTSIEQVASICNRRGFSGVPVVNSRQSLVGIVTVSDIIHSIFDSKVLSTFNAHGQVLEQQALAVLDDPVSKYMHRDIISAGPDATVKEVCSLMSENKIRRVPITNGDTILGIFSAQDAVRILALADLKTN